MNLKDQLRFESKFIRLGPDDCWIWQAGKTIKGYGQFRLNGKKPSAHRLSYELYVGPIPDKYCVCHKCDVRNCVNPSHLFPGTNKDNTNDMVQKNRQAKLKGVANGSAKLTEQQVLAIRADIRTIVAIAKDYGISYGIVYSIKRRITWKHI